MILSVSRRTDIPNYYADWFYNRLKEGFLYVRNPFNPHQISKIPLSPDVVDCIVFWTKNPENMLGRLEELKAYPFYFQFTLTGYGKDMEPGIPHKREHMLGVFQRLSEQIGADRVVWRYDPILFNHLYTPEYHLKAFEEIAGSLNGYTHKAVISFVDFYAKAKGRMKELALRAPSEEEAISFARKLAEIAGKNNMSAEACAERMDLQKAGVNPGSCIDQALIEKITGCKIAGTKDRNQREACGCLESIEVGTYNTCQNGCRYCYANGSNEEVVRNTALYDVNAPLLCGRIGPEDTVTERKVKSLKVGQLGLFDRKTSNDLQKIPGIGANMEQHLNNIGIRKIADLRGRDPEELYHLNCLKKGYQDDKCVLYVFRCAVYFAEHEQHEPEKLKWWYWKDRDYPEPET